MKNGPWNGALLGKVHAICVQRSQPNVVCTVYPFTE